MLLRQGLYVLVPILGASAPVTAFLLKDSSLVSKVIAPLAGGGSHSTLTFSGPEKRELVNSFGYSSPTTGINVVEFRNNSDSLEISSSGVHEHTILLEDALNSDKDGKVIHQIMKEVKKDFDARTIQGNSQGNLQDAKGQVFVHHIDFAKVKKTIEDWKKKRGNYQEVRQDLEEKLLRNAEVLQEDLKTLTQGEREALYLFYQKYTELREKKAGYSEQLKKVEDGKDLEDLRVKELSKERKVLNALEKIG